MNLQTERWKGVRLGAAYGLTAWLAYGAVEFILCSALPVVLSQDKTFSPWGWSLAGTLFGAYALAGMLFGSLAGLALLGGGKADRPERCAMAAALTLVLAFLVNLARAWPLARSEDIALGIGVLLALALAAAVYSDSSARRFHFLANPWAAALLLLAAPVISRELMQDRSNVVKLASSAAGLALAAAAFWALDRRRTASASWSKGMTAVVAVICVSAGATALLSLRGMGAPSAAAQLPSGKTNVVLIVMDTVRADHLSVYGYARDTTPFLKSFAKEATVYQQAIASGDGTLPTHASMFTGLYPSWHGAHYRPPDHPYGYALEKRFPTLSGVLAEKGYATAGVVANYAYLSREFGLDRGFDRYRVQAPVTFSHEARPFYLREGVRALLAGNPCNLEFDRRTRKAEEINRDALAWLDAADRRRPFFLFVNYMDAHAPYVPPAPYDRLFPGKDARFSEAYGRELERQVMSGRRKFAEFELRHMTSQYDGGIAYMDEQIGKLIGRLKQRGVYDDTMIIVSADHGEALGERNLMDHAITSLYQNVVRVPLLIKYPRQNSGRSEPMPVSQVDLMPTVLEVVGQPAPAPLHGQSLLRAPSAERTVYSESFPGILFVQLNKRFDGSKRALYTGSSKLITWSRGTPEFYDLARDPDEAHDLYRKERAQAAPLESRLTLWTKQAPVQARSPRAMDATNLQRLKSLGYAQ